MINLDRMLGAFQLCNRMGCYIDSEFKISKAAPKVEDAVQLSLSIISKVEKAVVNESFMEGTAKKCDELRKLIPAYFQRCADTTLTGAGTIDTTVNQRINSLITRFTFSKTYEEINLRFKKEQEMHRECQLRSMKRNLSDYEMSNIIDAPMGLEMELYGLWGFKRLLLDLKNIFDELKEWKDRLAKDGVLTTTSGRVLIFPSLKTENTTEVSLRLKTIAEIRRMLDWNIEMPSDKESLFLAKIQEEILHYRANNPARAEYCDDLLKFLLINTKLVKHKNEVSELSGSPEFKESSKLPKQRYIISLIELAFNDYIHTIRDMFENSNSLDCEDGLKPYFEKCKSLEAEYMNPKARKEGISLCNALRDFIKNLNTSVSTDDYESYLEDTPEDGYLESILGLYEDIEQLDKDRSFTIKDLLRDIKDRPLHKEKGLDFPPPLYVESKKSKPKKIKKPKTNRDTARVEIPAVKSSPGFEKEAKELLEKVKKLEIDLKIDAPKQKKAEDTPSLGRFDSLFPQPRLHFHERVLRWKRPGVMDIFHSDPNYNSKTYSDRTKKRIIFEHAFADAVAAVAMKEGNVSTTKADKDKYGAVKRVQVVGEVLFDGTEERVQGVFSFSQGKNGLWFHVGFTQQESEASCKNFLKTGLYCVEYPVLTKDSSVVKTSKVAQKSLPDGSFIESVSDNLVTIKDPANAATIYLARMK